MFRGLVGAGLLGIGIFWSRWKHQGDRVWTKTVSGGELSIAPYDRRTPDYHVMFYASQGGSVDGGRTGTVNEKEAKERAVAWFNRGMKGRA